ncbi:MAG: 2Fe-2S iron-sulfur cluster binding domain-containing protein [Deltaproteobacteria bacterium]|nr:2Fe-2S iron-sulfur cluster binding domain-containing protein [Deltaproteobacteria bacterium]
MIPETAHFVRDLFGYASLGFNRSRLARWGRGDDYTNEKYRELAISTADRIHPRAMNLRVVEIIDETPTTRTLRMQRIDGPLPPFSAGQYVNVFITIDGVVTSRPYSISSAPGVPHLDLTVRAKPGGFVSGHIFHKIAVGDELRTSGPSGWFRYERLIDGDDLVFIAGGSGITPFMGMLRGFAGRNDAPRIHLLYGSRTPEDVIFDKELKKLGPRLRGLKVTHVISEPPKGFSGVTGFLDADRIRKSVGNIEGKMFYLCGPGAMLDLCRAALKDLGVGMHRIRSELYGPPEDVTSIGAWPPNITADRVFQVQVEGRSAFDAAAGEPLINSLERNGVVVPSVCRSGECSACRIRLLAGEVFMPPGTGVREADRSHGYVHACMAYPITDIRIRL